MSSKDGGEVSLSPFIIYHHAGLYSACTSAGVLFYGLSRADAEQRLAEAGVDAAILDSPCDGLTWRSTLTAAFASELESIDSRLDHVATTEDVESVRQRQQAISASIGMLSASIKEEKRRRELADGEAELNRRAEAMFAQWPASFRTDPAYVALVWSSLRNSPLGKRIQELRQQ